MSKMLLWYWLKLLKLKKKRGSPILEEILLIGVAVFIFAVIIGVIYSLIDWAGVAFDEFFS
ncbi:MAG: hypothetical protein H7647_01165 [Candidatus Heimdallarchaeota archaeon]|nr:hypothetical protein [Candidatus Heimdallarchaeota archaeon]MCK4253042.1 hypothetical protein [Candidatus Heimdallarchaeota archaeon]